MLVPGSIDRRAHDRRGCRTIAFRLVGAWWLHLLCSFRHCPIVNIRGTSCRLRKHAELARRLHDSAAATPDRKQPHSQEVPAAWGLTPHMSQFHPMESVPFSSGVDIFLARTIACRFTSGPIKSAGR